MKKIINKILVGALTVLGFGSTVSCESLINKGLDEYGSPTAEYRLKGRVTDSSDPKKGVAGVRIKFQTKWEIEEAQQYKLNKEEYTGEPYELLFEDRCDDPSSFTTTKEDGSYEIFKRTFGWGEGLRATLKDIDGQENGLYEQKMDTVKIRKEEFKSRGSWVSAVEKNDVNFTITQKKPENQDE